MTERKAKADADSPFDCAQGNDKKGKDSYGNDEFTAGRSRYAEGVLIGPIGEGRLRVWMGRGGAGRWAAAAIVLCCFAGNVWAQQGPSTELPVVSAILEGNLLLKETPDEPQHKRAVVVLRPNSVSGTVVDTDGRAIRGAEVRLVGESTSGGSSAGGSQEGERRTTTASDGWFNFEGTVPGAFELEAGAPGFEVVHVAGTLRPGEILQLPPIVLKVASVSIVVEAVAESSTVELAEEQMHAEEKQRLIGVLPNFYVSYNPDAAPLNARQKFALAFKNASDPGNLFLVGTVAGVQQAWNSFPGYRQGAQGYGKRYGADLANLWVGTYMGGAILPSLFRQDPRYFYKGTGTARSRALYAISRVLICKGDNGRWQPNYSGVLGDLSAGAISNIYYAPTDRQGPLLTLENGLLGIAGDAMNNLFQEFVFSHFTTKGPGSGIATQGEAGRRKVKSGH